MHANLAIGARQPGTSLLDTTLVGADLIRPAGLVVANHRIAQTIGTGLIDGTLYADTTVLHTLIIDTDLAITRADFGITIFGIAQPVSTAETFGTFNPQTRGRDALSILALVTHSRADPVTATSRVTLVINASLVGVTPALSALYSRGHAGLVNTNHRP